MTTEIHIVLINKLLSIYRVWIKSPLTNFWEKIGVSWHAFKIKEFIFRKFKIVHKNVAVLHFFFKVLIKNTYSTNNNSTQGWPVNAKHSSNLDRLHFGSGWHTHLLIRLYYLFLHLHTVGKNMSFKKGWRLKLGWSYFGQQLVVFVIFERLFFKLNSKRKSFV